LLIFLLRSAASLCIDAHGIFGIDYCGFASTRADAQLNFKGGTKIRNPSPAEGGWGVLYNPFEV
jgi:hypothetical protein